MTKKRRSLFREVEIGCGRCRKVFPASQPMVIDIEADPDLLEKTQDLSIFKPTCLFCGFAGLSPMMFVYVNPGEGQLWFVFHEAYTIKYLLIKNALGAFFDEYLSGVPESERSRIKSLKAFVIPIPVFLLRINSPLAEGTGLGIIHFSPFPKMNLPNSSAASWNPAAATPKLGPHEIALAEGNHPEFFDKVWDLSKWSLQMGVNRSYLKAISNVARDSAPVATYGIADVLFYAGSSVLVPILVGVISNLISQLVLEKKKTKAQVEAELERARSEEDPREELLLRHFRKILEAQDNPMQPSDPVCLRIRSVDDGSEYVFQGVAPFGGEKNGGVPIRVV